MNQPSERSGDTEADSVSAADAVPDGPGQPRAAGQEQSQQAGDGAENQGDQDTGTAHRQRNWEAFSFHHQKLKHLTTVGLVFSGGVITLFQSEIMAPGPWRTIALVLPILSSMLTLAAQVSLGNETLTGNEEQTRDAFGIPMTVHWFQLVALVLLSSAIGWAGVFLFIDIGLLPR